MKKVFKWIGIIFVAFIVLTIVIGSQGSKESPKAYEVLSKEELKTVENYSLLVDSTDKARGAAEEVKKSCKLPCNIAVYDNKKAFDLEEEYKKLTDLKEAESWKQTNYVFVADHLVGNIDFETGTYQEYPYHDWYYDELKAK